jgi:hypothetical protein
MVPVGVLVLRQRRSSQVSTPARGSPTAVAPPTFEIVGVDGIVRGWLGLIVR